MKRTTLFLPEDIHEGLREEAFRSRISMAELIRLRLKPSPAPLPDHIEDPLMEAAGICRGPVLSDNIDEQLYGE